MSLSNVNYKNISFTRPDGVNVSLKANINNPSDLNEDFLILSVDKFKSKIENKLFYWIDKRRYTINEFQYFALNNNLCMKVTDMQGTELASYGLCETVARKFNHVFGINFN